MLPLIPVIAAGSFVAGMVVQGVGTLLHQRRQQAQARRAAEERLRQVYSNMTQQERDFAAEVLRQMANQTAEQAAADSVRQTQEAMDRASSEAQAHAQAAADAAMQQQMMQ